ncbi:MAG TPA: ribonuclease HI family protein [Smithellaceae bacterium]|nr:ribonuclease HI family protein [Smithellaceae bacterium]HNT91608.1 ribonuclease HI family protein [Smithellaceae bacterium]HNV64491.1 ribonuclease HI family protein [Smithellaceae bacterium]HOD30579.1 ribonuclease HI family protein [Smithellaceae bacterium]HOF78211.1 ribonuclease HI family protein [Smithellaceae bacterium]
MEKKSYKLYTDGACRGNPGIGGAGAVITDANENILWEGKQYLGHCTNNIAEYKALIMGLKSALQNGYKNMEVYLDSELLARQINGVYKVKNENLKKLMREVRHLLSSFESIQVKHVTRCHNAHADKLANLAVDENI